MCEAPDAGSDRGLLLGVDIGGTKILGGLVDRTGRIVERRQRATRPGHVLPDTVETCHDLLEAAARAGCRTAGIGVGAKGAVDCSEGRLVGSLYLGHGEIPIGDHLSRTFGLPVRVENDVHAATIGEQVFGIGREVDDFVFFNAGTGIAIGIVVGRRLYRGASNTAGENGHVTIDHSGLWPCPCGMTGCFETMIVGARRGDELPRLPGLTANDEAGHQVYTYLASNLLDIIAIFAPSAVVLGGGMVNGRNTATTWMTDVVSRSVPALLDGLEIPIHHAFAGQDAGLVGAAALHMGLAVG